MKINLKSELIEHLSKELENFKDPNASYLLMARTLDQCKNLLIDLDIRKRMEQV